MNERDIAEQAYKNGKEVGYLQGYEDGKNETAKSIFQQIRKASYEDEQEIEVLDYSSVIEIAKHYGVDVN